MLKASLRYLLQHPIQTLTAIIGVALGSGIVLSMDLAIANSESSFINSQNQVHGRANYRVISKDKDSYIEENWFFKLKSQFLIPMAPVIRVNVAIKNLNIPLWGVDIFSEKPFREFIQPTIKKPEFFFEPNIVLVFGKLKINKKSFNINFNKKIIKLKQLQTKNDFSKKANMLLMDIANLQKTLNLKGKLSWIDLIVQEDQAKQIELFLPSHLMLEAIGKQTESSLEMSRAFSMNLFAMSLLALIVGAFLIYNTLYFSVTSRAEIWGLLRSIGATRWNIIRIVVIEAIILGGVGTILGVLLSNILVSEILKLITKTYENLYFTILPVPITWSSTSILKSILLGMGGSLISSVWPAMQASRASIRNLISISESEKRLQNAFKVAFLIGLIFAFICIFLLLFSKSLLGGFIAIFSAILSFALIAPLTIGYLLSIIGSFALFPFSLKFAARAARSSLSQTGVAISALAIAVSIAISVGIMVHSFRITVNQWLKSRLIADIYIRPSVGNRVSKIFSLDKKAIEAIEQISFRGKSTYSYQNIIYKNKMIPLVSLDLFIESQKSIQFIDSDLNVWKKFEQENGVLISEPFQRKFEISTGDSIELQTKVGLKTFSVIGVFSDYAREGGMIYISSKTASKYWPNITTGSVALFLKAKQAPELVQNALFEKYQGSQVLDIQKSSLIRSEALRIFDETFAITKILQILAILIAVIGIFSALMAISYLKKYEHAIYRTLGFLPSQVFWHNLLQNTLSGLLAGVWAVPMGIALSWLLIFVINVRAFGWTMQWEIQIEELILGVLFASIAGALSSFLPSLSMAKNNPSILLRERL